MLKPEWFSLRGHPLLSLIYPRTCPGCEEALPNGRSLLCESCHSNLKRIQKPFCLQCGEPFQGVVKKLDACANCRERTLHFEFARAGYMADGQVRDWVHALKYQRQIHLAPLLARLMEEALHDPRIASEYEWTLVPVPLHPRRLRERHFNQAEELVRLMARSTGWSWINALERTRYTTTQAHLERRERLDNLKGAFTLRKRAGVAQLKGQKILLVDDILTTGSTADECAKVLKQEAKASRVAVVTVARGGYRIT